MDDYRFYAGMESIGYHKLVSVKFTDNGKPYTYLCEFGDDVHANDFVVVAKGDTETYAKVFSVFWVRQEDIAYDISRMKPFNRVVTDEKEQAKACWHVHNATEYAKNIVRENHTMVIKKIQPHGLTAIMMTVVYLGMQEINF